MTRPVPETITEMLKALTELNLITPEMESKLFGSIYVYGQLCFVDGYNTAVDKIALKCPAPVEGFTSPLAAAKV